PWGLPHRGRIIRTLRWCGYTANEGARMTALMKTNAVSTRVRWLGATLARSVLAVVMIVSAQSSSAAEETTTDPPSLFASRCAACHGLGVVAPTLEQMSHLTSWEIQSALWQGALAPEQMGGQDIYVMGCEEWVDPTRPECSPVNPKGEGDRDFGAPAALTRLANGTTLLLAGSKDGMFYALDPDSGKVIWKLRVGA